MAKWKTFRHNGIYFPPEYVWKKLYVKIIGERFEPDAQQEEMLYAWAKKINTPYVNDPVFQQNFLNDLKKILPRKYSSIKIDDIDFSQIVKYQENEKDLTKDEKKVLAMERKKQKEILKERYGYVEIDGVKCDMANWMVEPPGIFMGRGQHPIRGKWKPRIKSEDVILNLDKGASVPAGKWKQIINGNDYMWVASWKDALSDKMKYIWPHEGSHLRQKRDMDKYDKAMSIDVHIGDIKKAISEGMKSKDERIRQVATACYLIDNLVMRVGDEKDEDEADTVGASTLRVEHIKFNPDSIEFDFLGKDSVRWEKVIKFSEADPAFVRNMKDFTNGKNRTDLVFHGIDSGHVNEFLGKCLKGLTAKVFRTYHATKTLSNYLKNIKISKDAQTNLYNAKLANLEVAMMCNHKKTPPKTWEETFARKEEKLT
ncbi:MAG: DNA topoisomerase I, partial [Nitrosopumilales archaeon]|nr:DNA topoisomerase I [Nitrosopumilales archaeon]